MDGSAYGYVAVVEDLETADIEEIRYRVSAYNQSLKSYYSNETGNGEGAANSGFSCH